MPKIRTVTGGHFTHTFFCPGCKCGHGFNAGIPEAPYKPVWQFNGDMEKPTVNPSIKVSGTVPITDEERDKLMNGEKVEPKPFVCHSVITNGKIQFMGDCTHELKGQTVDMEDF
jgi:hypothetical protein